ncbi:cyclin-dependent kinase inhibitor 1C-like [Xiphophorus hellerii]|uniref:cyclin-dependent kinase inhibitor 1C-like n=1 Tax=Xiphophorus hellerii TaxID=8084 RepID=UPI0013B425C7|nr:cyclin-dependent kinase inhibitor 1C-like [Xiphophorus hellerii]
MSHVQLSSSALERLVARRTFPLQRRTGVCRSLFGPVDHDELSRDVKAKLREISERDQQRWNFNFEDNTPLEGDYEWEEMPAERTAAFYRESVQSGRTRVPATPVKQTPFSESVMSESSDGDVMERLAVPESDRSVVGGDGESSSPTPAEVNQENRPVTGISGTRRQAPRVRRKRSAAAAAADDNNTHITDFFMKRKKAADRLPKSPISLEQTPRKRIR